MSATGDPRRKRSDPETARAVWGRVRTALERERDQLVEAIASYPPPIPACDEHFNSLLERRERVGRQLARARICAQSGSLADCRSFLDALDGSPRLLSEAVESELRSWLPEEVS